MSTTQTDATREIKMAAVFRSLEKSKFEAIVQSPSWEEASPVPILSKYDFPTIPGIPNKKSANALFEQLDLGLYKEKANMVGFRIQSKEKFIKWIQCITYRYHITLGADDNYTVHWTDRQCSHDPTKHDEIMLQICPLNDPDHPLVTIHIFLTTYLITVQGNLYLNWAKMEFDYLKSIVDASMESNMQTLVKTCESEPPCTDTCAPVTAHQNDETPNVCPTQSAESINDTSPKSIGSETLNSTPSGPQDFGVSTPPRIVTPRPSLDVFNTPTGGSAPYTTKSLQTLETNICTEFHNVVQEVSLLTKNNVEFKEEIRKIIESSKTELANENKQFKDEILN